MKISKQIITAPDAETLARVAADHFSRIAAEAVAATGRFSVALSGGSTPKILYRELVASYADRIPWSAGHFFWSDERWVPISDPESNAGMALTHLLNPLHIDEARIHPVNTTLDDPHEAAREYERLVRDHFVARPPRFDVIFLGLGTDGHTASLFPGTEATEIRDRLVAANWVPQLDRWRITFTYPLINAARNILFLVSGENKANIVADIFVKNIKHHPAARVHPENGNLYWYLDVGAAKLLKSRGNHD